MWNYTIFFFLFIFFFHKNAGNEGTWKKQNELLGSRERKKRKGKLSLTVIWWLSKENYIKNSSDDVFHSSSWRKALTSKASQQTLEFSLHRLIGCCHRVLQNLSRIWWNCVQSFSVSLLEVLPFLPKTKQITFLFSLQFHMIYRPY